MPFGLLQALFPGVVYLPEHFKKPQYLKEIADNAYARARFDSVIIDAKNERAFATAANSPPCSCPPHTFVDDVLLCCGSPAAVPRNPFAVAHKINHPPEGTAPNVLPFAFDFPPEGLSNTSARRAVDTREWTLISVLVAFTPSDRALHVRRVPSAHAERLRRDAFALVHVWQARSRPRKVPAVLQPRLFRGEVSHVWLFERWRLTMHRAWRSSRRRISKTRSCFSTTGTRSLAAEACDYPC